MYIEYGTPEFENPEAAVCDVLPLALRFTPADLARNRDGRLSTAQMIRLIRQVVALAYRILLNTGFLLSILIFVAAFAGILAGMLSLGVPINIFKRGVLRYWFAVWAVASMVGTLLLVLAGVLGRKAGLLHRLFCLAQDFASGQVASYSGRVSTNRSEDFDDPLAHGTVSYCFWTPDEKFEVPLSAYKALEAQDCRGFYTLYFTPRSRFLVSMEPATVEQLARQRLAGAVPPNVSPPPPPAAPPSAELPDTNGMRPLDQHSHEARS